jgi:hypothetical protein
VRFRKRKQRHRVYALMTLPVLVEVSPNAPGYIPEAQRLLVRVDAASVVAAERSPHGDAARRLMQGRYTHDCASRARTAGADATARVVVAPDARLVLGRAWQLI